MMDLNCDRSEEFQHIERIHSVSSTSYTLRAVGFSGEIIILRLKHCIGDSVPAIKVLILGLFNLQGYAGGSA